MTGFIGSGREISWKNAESVVENEGRPAHFWQDVIMHRNGNAARQREGWSESSKKTPKHRNACGKNEAREKLVRYK